VNPPPAAVARLDSAPLPLPERKPAMPKAPARADRPLKGIALILASTVFLGLDHSFGQCKLSVLWETMVFGGPHDKYCDRYTSRADADDGHKRTVRMVQDSAQ